MQGRYIRCKTANKNFNARERVEMAVNGLFFPFPYCPVNVNRQCLWKKKQDRKKFTVFNRSKNLFIENSKVLNIIFN